MCSSDRLLQARSIFYCHEQVTALTFVRIEGTDVKISAFRCISKNRHVWWHIMPCQNNWSANQSKANQGQNLVFRHCLPCFLKIDLFVWSYKIATNFLILYIPKSCNSDKISVYQPWDQWYYGIFPCYSKHCDPGQLMTFWGRFVGFLSEEIMKIG